ncbi:Hypothetical predicted protein [Paramuricea clavata]|uniref:Uncharacterized protein n=1 Tax=Paramuricea clavata TaxID=317549 RepID=A0A7D9JLC7_PARCT|nr:Hypothetical predicted protein [Paramuricea clavata]
MTQHEKRLIDEHVQNLGKIRKVVPEDGHCMLHAFVLGLENSQYKLVELLKPMIKKEVMDNINFYTPFLNNGWEAKLDDYLRHKKYDASVVDLMYHILANITNSSVVVFYLQDNNVCELPKIHPRNGDSGCVIYVSRIGQHYDAVLDIESEKRVKFEGRFR